MNTALPHLGLLLALTAPLACSSGSSGSPTGADSGVSKGAGGSTAADASTSVSTGGAGVTPPDGGAPKSDRIAIPGGSTGIGFDDLMYSAKLHRVLAPSGWTGNVNLINPDTLEVTTISGFSSDPSWKSGDDTRGVGSADEGNGFVFGGDRTSTEIGVIDPAQKKIIAKVPTKGYPDYIRYVERTGELWVAEPFAGQIEVFKGAKDGALVSDGTIPVPGGPESLVIDQTKGLALTMHLFAGEVVAIDVSTRKQIGVWPTGCGSSHGLVAVDEQRGFVFPGCLERARGVVLDLNSAGALVDEHQISTSGSTLVAFSSKLRHFYMRGDPGLPLAFLGVSAAGKLTPLNTFDSVQKAHCLAADDVGGVWTCDWNAGEIVRYKDPYPASK